MGKPYRVTEIFHSIQGEGVRAGIPHVFVRFSGCNIQCTKATHGFDCDTDHRQLAHLELGNLVHRIESAAPRGTPVLLTGGEPLLQVDRELLEALKTSRRFVAIETNGTIRCPAADLVDWLTVSPKVPEADLQQKYADEVKYVLAYGDELPATTVRAKHRLLSPAFAGDAPAPLALEHCVKLVKANPRWRLSVQQHPRWRIK